MNDGGDYMRVNIILFLLLVLPVTLAKTGWAADSELAQLKEQMQKIQQQMDEMQTSHDREIAELKKHYEEELKDLKEQMKKASPGETVTDEQEAQSEADYLRQLAQSLAGEEEKKKSPEETVFKFGGLSLQKMNPEISLAGDVTWDYHDQDDTRRRSGFDFRYVEVNFQAYLDPYSRLKAVIPATEDDVAVEEAYYTYFGLGKDLNVDIGKFRQQFGVVNRWHEHGLDQIEHPMPIKRIFGPEGLAQTGVSFDWTMPKLGESYQGLIVQITNSENEQLFGGETLGNPSVLFHYKNYRDLTDNTYLEWGLSGLCGWMDEWMVSRTGTVQQEHDALCTQVWGADLTVLWEPMERALYRNLEWRSEFFYLDRDLLAPDGTGRDDIQAWGAFSYVQSKISRKVTLGIRGDFFKPDSKDYATLDGLSTIPLAYSNKTAYRWQVSPYITWQQSEWVKFRSEYDHADGRGMEKAEDIFWLQVIFEAGPHKHERY